MYINGRKLKVRRYSSGELKFIKSDLNSYAINNRVKIVYLGEYSLFELLLILKYYVSNGVLVDLILSYLPYQRMDHRGRDELDTVNYVADIFAQGEIIEIQTRQFNRMRDKLTAFLPLYPVTIVYPIPGKNG